MLPPLSVIQSPFFYYVVTHVMSHSTIPHDSHQSFIIFSYDSYPWFYPFYPFHISLLWTFFPMMTNPPHGLPHVIGFWPSQTQPCAQPMSMDDGWIKYPSLDWLQHFQQMLRFYDSLHGLFMYINPCVSPVITTKSVSTKSVTPSSPLFLSLSPV